MNQERKTGISIMTIISIFFCVFGLSLLAALFFTEPGKGIIVNLICSFLFFIISGGAFLISKKNG